MTLLTNRANLRTNLKIDPNGRIWSNATLNRFLNEGQREIINDPDVDWPFKQTTGYFVPPNADLAEYIQSNNNDP